MKRKMKYKAPDLVDYKNLGFNPFVNSQDVYDKLNDTHYDVSQADHRRRINRWKERENERNELAKRLGTTYQPKLTPVDEILSKLPK